MRMIDLLVVSALASACGGDDDARTSNPVAPTPPATSLSESAREHLDVLLNVLESHSAHARRIDWVDLRAQVFAIAGVAQTIPETYPAIQLAIRSLNDYKTLYIARDGRQIQAGPNTPCGASATGAINLPRTIGYVRVPECNCVSDGEVSPFAETIQQTIRSADHPGLVGWIVDRRGNRGGNVWPMITGIGPIIGEGIIGYIVYNDSEYEREYRDGAAQSFGEILARVERPYTLMRENPRVAVLTDGAIFSSGEAIVVYFRNRPNTRSFGTTTCGHHYLLEEFELRDGARLQLVTAVITDRQKVPYEGPVSPDEVIADPQLALSRAVSWLLD